MEFKIGDEVEVVNGALDGVEVSTGWIGTVARDNNQEHLIVRFTGYVYESFVYQYRALKLVEPREDDYEAILPYIAKKSPNQS